MVNEKGVESSVADAIGKYVKIKGDETILNELEKNEEFVANKEAQAGLEDLRKLAKFSKILEFTENVGYLDGRRAP